jgi:hypothetical protein
LPALVFLLLLLGALALFLMMQMVLFFMVHFRFQLMFQV